MTEFDIQDMTCGHCVASVTRAVQALDPNAKVSVDLPSHRVSIDTPSVTPQALQAALEDAGYTPILR